MEPKKNWFRRHIYLTVFLILFGIPILIGIIGSATDSSNSPKIEATNNQVGETNATNSKPVEQIKKVVFPVEIVTKKIQNDSVGTPIFHVTIKNTSDKTIDAVTVIAFFSNNFDEPVGKWGLKKEDPFAGIIQEKIPPKGTYSTEWNLAVYDTATKIKEAEIYKVHFTDGTTISLE